MSLGEKEFENYIFQDKLLRYDFDIHHISLASRKSDLEHAMVRLVISTLASVDEIENFVKKNIGKKRINGFFTVRLSSAGKSRIAFVDDKTHETLLKVSEGISGRSKLFPFSKKDMDEIIRKYSPPDRDYDLEKLRDAVMKILRDCMFFGNEDYVAEILEGKVEKVADFVYDFHPMFSGMWDADDVEVAAEFVRCYSSLTGVNNPKDIASKFSMNVETVKKILEL